MRGMVVCPEPPAAEAGKEILKQGGNAADAVAAAAFAQGVSAPFSTGLGGMGIMYIRHGPTGETAVIDCLCAAGSLLPPREWAEEFVGRHETYGRYILRSEANQMGYKSIMVPGVIRGCGELTRRFGSGKVPWERLLAPAVRLAGEGFAVYDTLAAGWRGREEKPGLPALMRKLALYPDGGRVYGEPRSEGERFEQPDYGRTLQRIAAGGPDEFYSGDLGGEVFDDLARNGALIAQQDLTGYQVYTQPPIAAPYRDLTVEGPAPPGGTDLVIAMLQMADGFNWTVLDPLGPDYVDLICRIQREAFHEHMPLKGDPPFSATLNRLHRIISRSFNAGLQARIRSAASFLDPGTSHVTAVDEEGTVVCFTHSIGSAAGSGVVTPGMGFLWNNFLGHLHPLPGNWDAILPGKRAGGGSPMVVYRDGRPLLALGAPGGSRIFTACFQTILNHVERGLGIGDAVSAPRCHSEEEGLIFVEPAFPDATVTELKRRGYDVRRSNYFARVQAIQLSPEGGWQAGADPRGGRGQAAIL